MVLIDDADGLAERAAQKLTEFGYTNTAILTGGMAAWRTEGRPLEAGLTGVLAAPDDVVPAGPDRSFADMINYLRWEERLGQKYAAEEASS